MREAYYPHLFQDDSKLVVQVLKCDSAHQDQIY